MIVLTGGAGFIGSCFLRKLNDEGINDVIVVDHLGTSQKWKNLQQKKYIDFVHKDRFIELLQSGKWDSQIDAIVHLGACSSTTELDADYLMENNYNYSKTLAQYAADNSIRFIYASSAATYGDGLLGYSDHIFDNLVPMNGYGYSKHAFDLWVIAQGLDKQFVGLKYFNVFGPNEYHKANMSSMVYKSFNQIVQTGKVKLFRSNTEEFGDGEQRRDFIYVKDCNNIMWQLLNSKNIAGIFNIGTGKSRTWNDLASSVFSSLNKEVNIEYVDMPESISSQYQNYTEADISKLLNTGINYQPTTLENSISDYVINYLSQNYSIY